MNKDTYYDTLFDYLVGDLKSKEELAKVLNFLDNIKTIINHLYWARQFKQDLEKDREF